MRDWCLRKMLLSNRQRDFWSDSVIDVVSVSCRFRVRRCRQPVKPSCLFYENFIIYGSRKIIVESRYITVMGQTYFGAPFHLKLYLHWMRNELNVSNLAKRESPSCAGQMLRFPSSTITFLVKSKRPRCVKTLTLVCFLSFMQISRKPEWTMTFLRIGFLKILSLQLRIISGNSS